MRQALKYMYIYILHYFDSRSSSLSVTRVCAIAPGTSTINWFLTYDILLFCILLDFVVVAVVVQRYYDLSILQKYNVVYVIVFLVESKSNHHVCIYEYNTHSTSYIVLFKNSLSHNFGCCCLLLYLLS